MFRYFGLKSLHFSKQGKRNHDGFGNYVYRQNQNQLQVEHRQIQIGNKRRSRRLLLWNRSDLILKSFHDVNLLLFTLKIKYGTRAKCLITLFYNNNCCIIQKICFNLSIINEFNKSISIQLDSWIQ